MGSPAWHSHLCLEVTIRWFCGLPGCCPVQGQSFSGLGRQRSQGHRFEGAPALMPPVLGQAGTLPGAGLFLWREQKGLWQWAGTFLPGHRTGEEAQQQPVLPKVTEQSGVKAEFKCRFAQFQSWGSGGPRSAPLKCHLSAHSPSGSWWTLTVLPVHGAPRPLLQLQDFCSRPG